MAFLLILITICAILLATLYMRFRKSVPKANREVWNRKDTSSLENVLQKIIGKNMTSYIVDTSSQKNTFSPFVPRYNSSGIAFEQNEFFNQQLEETRPKNEFSIPTNLNHQELVNSNVAITTSQIPTQQNEPLPNQSKTNSDKDLPSTIIYRKPTTDRLEKKPIYTSPFTKKPSTPHSSASKKKVIYFDNSKFLDGVGVSPILPNKKVREEPIYVVPNSSFMDSTILLEPITDMETKPQSSTQINTSEGETTGIADSSMISVGDNKKSPKSILRKRDPLGNFSNQYMNLSTQLNESDILNSSILRKKKVDFDQAVKNQNLKRSRPVGFERSAPPPSETSFSRENQKRTKTTDTIISNTTAPTVFESPKPTSPVSPPTTTDDSVMIDNSMITESLLDKNDSIILDCKFIESKPNKRKKGGRIGFSTPSTLRNQKILRYDEDILQRKELAFYLLKGEPSPEKKNTTQTTNKSDDNLGSSFNLSSLAKRSTDTVPEENTKTISTSSNVPTGFTLNTTTIENKKKEEKTNAPTFVIPTSEAKPTEPIKKTISEQTVSANDTTKQTPSGLDLSAFKQPEPKPKTDTIGVPSSSITTQHTTSSKIPNLTVQPTIDSTKLTEKPESEKKTETTPSSSANIAPKTEANLNPFSNLKNANTAEPKKTLLNPFSSTNVFGKTTTPSLNTLSSADIFGSPSRNVFSSKTTPSKPGVRVSDFAKMDPSIFTNTDTLSIGKQNKQR